MNFVLRARANHGGKNPAWSSYEKLREVIEKKMFSNTEDLLPVISFNAKASVDDQQKHQGFVARMVVKGYTEKQVRLLCDLTFDVDAQAWLRAGTRREGSVLDQAERVSGVRPARGQLGTEQTRDLA